mgnify:CR=1 FL=1
MKVEVHLESQPLGMVPHYCHCILHLHFDKVRLQKYFKRIHNLATPTLTHDCIYWLKGKFFSIHQFLYCAYDASLRDLPE